MCILYACEYLCVCDWQIEELEQQRQKLSAAEEDNQAELEKKIREVQQRKGRVEEQGGPQWVCRWRHKHTRIEFYYSLLVSVFVLVRLVGTVFVGTQSFYYSLLVSAFVLYICTS